MRTMLPVLAVLCVLPLAAQGGEAPPAAGQTPAAAPAVQAPAERPLSIEETVLLALRHNLALAAQKINPQLAATVVVEQEAIFDPVATGDYAHNKSKQQTTSSASSASPAGTTGAPATTASVAPSDIEPAVVRQQNFDAELALSKLFPLGTLAEAHVASGKQWTGQAFPAINPAWTDDIGWSLTQPLLRGFGVRVNTAAIATARNDLRIAQQQLRNVALDTVSQAKMTYWELVYSIRNRQLLQRSLDRAIGLRSDVQARVEAKVLGERDPSVSQAVAGVAVIQEYIVVADEAIRNVQDLLKVVTDLASDPNVWKISLIPTTEPPRTVPPVDADRSVEIALANRPDYQQAKLIIENEDIAVLVTRNGLLPQLNASFGFDYTGLDDSSHEARHDLRKLDYYNWALGLTLEYPLGNRAARSRFRRARLSQRQATIGLAALERQIELVVRTAVRTVESNVQSLRAAEASVAAETERLRAEEIRYKEAGVGTAQDVLDAQYSLALAESRALRAFINLNQSIVAVQRAQGTLLESSDVIFEEE